MTSSIQSFWNRFEPLFALQEQDEPSFYVNPYTLDIHESHSLYGFSWKCVYICLKILTGHDYETEAMSAWLLFIKKSWSHASSQIQNAVQCYKAALADSHERNLDPSRDIIAIGEQSRQFLDFLDVDALSRNIVTVQKVFLKVFHEEFFIQEDISLLQNLRSAYASSCCEGIIQHGMPVSILKKLIDDTPLLEVEDEILDDWISAIEGSSLFISSLLLHRALHLFVEDQNDLGSLELALIKRGMNRLCSVDPIWDNYLYSICPGTMIFQGIILGERKHNAALAQRQLDMYLQEDGNHRYILVGTTPTALTRYLAQGKKQCLLPVIEVDVCSGSGCFAITEPIEQALDFQYWTATKDVFEQKQLLLANEISSFVTQCLQNNQMPREMSLSRFVITKTDKLVTLTPTVIGDCLELEYEALEKFVEKVSCDNIFVFQYIMKTSKLHEHQDAITLRQTMKGTIFEYREIEVSETAPWYVFLFYSQYNDVRAQVAPARWNELKEALATKLITILEQYGVSASEWQNSITDIFKEAINEVLVNFLHGKQINTNTPIFPNWYHN